MTNDTARPRWLVRRATTGVAAALMPLLVACGGGKTDAEPKPTITDADQLVQGVAVKYESATEHKIQRAQAVQGQIVFISVVSDVEGRLVLEGEESIRQPVVKNELSTVVMDASELGEFDLKLRHDGGETVLATVKVDR